jgi:hypothetical protein
MSQRRIRKPKFITDSQEEEDGLNQQIDIIPAAPGFNLLQACPGTDDEGLNFIDGFHRQPIVAWRTIIHDSAVYSWTEPIVAESGNDNWDFGDYPHAIEHPDGRCNYRDGCLHLWYDDADRLLKRWQEMAAKEELWS